MNAIDTNVLVRFLVQDDEAQAQKVMTLFSESEKNKEPLFVSHVVLLELTWVLQSAYDVPREAIIASINELLSMVMLEFQGLQAIRNFINAAQDNTFDLTDLLISHVAESHDCLTTLTFDKKAAKSPLFTAL